MTRTQEFVFLLCLAAAWTQEEGEFYYGKFPDGFMWSSATSAYQIEGAWNADGKGESIWDRFVRDHSRIADNSTGDIACDSYNRYKEDIQLLKDMKVTAYRFSIAWTRLQPNGTGDPLKAGLDYYNKLIDELKNANIIPVVTLYHWDLPQALEDHGGWLNESIVDIFANYSRLCYREFGPKVKYWVTLNEPWVVAWLGYGSGSKAPGYKDNPGTYPYIVGHNLIKAHAKAYHIYHEEFHQSQQGYVGMSYNVGWSEPKSDSQRDKDAAERAMQFDMGWFAHPTQINGDYPEVMKVQVLQKSRAQGLNQSRLPEFTEEEKKYINQTNDYFGLNFYGGGYTEHENRSLDPPSYESDKDTKGSANPNWIKSGSGWLNVTPWSMRKILVWIKERYGNPPLLVTENGVSDRNGSLDDQHRIYYYKHYINQMLKAIRLDGCDVIGYTAWSLMDNFEWEQGYIERFGLTYVNFTDPQRRRTAKASARYFAKIIQDNGFPKPESGGANSSRASFGFLSCLLIIFSTFCKV